MFSNAPIQTATYRERGFLVVENLLSPTETELLRQRTRDIAEGRVPEFPLSDVELEPGAEDMSNMDGQSVPTTCLKRVRKLNRCAENDPVFLSHAKNDRILDVVESLIGPDIMLFDSQCFMKPPGGVEKPYHQDSAYFTLEPMDLVTCWTALDDVTLENGPLWVIPGSHRLGLLDHSQDWFVGNRRDMQVPDKLLERSRETPITMPAGSCSFHHSLLLHRSPPNHSVRSRRGLAVHYMSASSRWTHPTQPQPTYLSLRGRKYSGCV